MRDDILDKLGGARDAIGFVLFLVLLALLAVVAKGGGWTHRH